MALAGTLQQHPTGMSDMWKIPSEVSECLLDGNLCLCLGATTPLLVGRYSYIISKDHKGDEASVVVVAAAAVVPAGSLTSLTILLILRAFFSARLSSDVRLWKCDVPFILLKSFLYFSCKENPE